MAINFPDNPIANVTTHTVGDVVYTFDGEKWAAEAVPIDPPELTSVAITEGSNTNRFTSSTFTVTPTIAEDGNPASAKDLKLQVTPDITATPVTEAISAVGTAQVSDGIERNLLNDNSWYNTFWAGAPYNVYITHGNGTSTQNLATSPDGRTWTRVQVTRSGSAWNLPTRAAYCPVDGALYVMDREYVSSSGTRPVAYRAAPGTFDFVRESYNPSVSGINANSSHHSWGDLFWSYEHDRWFMSRMHSSNGHAANWMRGPTTASLATGWTDLRSFTGYTLHRAMIHQDGSGTWSANGANQSGSNTGDKSFYFSSPNTSGSNYRILGSGRNIVGRWAKVGTAGWIAPGSTYYTSSVGDQIHIHLGNAPTNTATPTMTAVSSLFTDITSCDLRDALWIDSLGIGVLCGKASTATRDNEGIIITTTDCQNFTRHWTNPTGDNSQYRWSWMFWNGDRNELVLVADQGTYPAGRAGYSKTVFQSATFTELTFVGVTGLTNFDTGADIEQADQNASGVVVEVDAAGGTMAVDTAAGTWAVGQTVEGDPGSYTRGYAVMDSNGNVSDITPSDPGWTRMNGDGPYNITFPATFNDGQVPDTALPGNTAIQAEMRVISQTQGFTADDTASSTAITPV